MVEQTSSSRAGHFMKLNKPAPRLLKPLTLLLIGIGTLLVLGGSYVIGSTAYGLYVIGAAVGLAFGLTIVLRPENGVYVLFAFVYLNLSDILTTRLGLPDSNKILFVLVLVGFIANRVVVHNKPIIFRRTEIVILFYGLAMLLSTFIATERGIAADKLVDWVKDFAILFLVVQLSGIEVIWKRSQWVLIWAAMLLSGLSTFQVVTGNYEMNFGGLALSPVHQIVGSFDSTRVSGPLEDPNFYAQILLMVLPLTAYRLFDSQEKPILRLMGGLGSLLIAAVVIFTYSRAAFAAMVLLALLIALERRFNIYQIVIVGAVALMLFLPFLPPSYVNRLATLTDILPSSGSSTQTERSFQGRTSEMIIAIQMFADHPVLGVGPGNYAENYLVYSSQLGLDDRLENRQAHSLYLEIASEMGVLGLIAFASMLSIVLFGTRRAKKMARKLNRSDFIPWISAVQLSLTSYLMTSVFLHGDYTRYLWLIIALAASSSVVMEKLSMQQAQREHDNMSNYALD